MVPESEVDKLFRSPPFNDEEKVLYQKCPVFDLIKEFPEFLCAVKLNKRLLLSMFKKEYDLRFTFLPDRLLNDQKERFQT